MSMLVRLSQQYHVPLATTTIRPHDRDGASRRPHLRRRTGAGSLAVAAFLSASVCLRAAGAESGITTSSVIDSVVEPDSEINTWVLRALTAMRSGSPDGAIPLLLPLLRCGPETLASTNGTTFIPARKLALELIRSLPDRTLSAYRLKVETSTAFFRGQHPATDAATLESQFRESLPGAAMAGVGLRLAGFYLDQQRFRDARRILTEALDATPPNSGMRPEVLARLLVACARVGDAPGAGWAWAELQKEPDAARWAALRAEIRPPDPSDSNGWMMAYGEASRTGANSAHLNLATNIGWLLKWEMPTGAGLVRSGTTNPPSSLGMPRAYVAACMTDRHLRPSDELIFSGTRAWINDLSAFIIVDTESGRLIQSSPHRTDPSVSEGPGGITINNVVIFGMRNGNEGIESWMFGNRLSRSASAIGGRVYCIEEGDRATLERTIRERQVQAVIRITSASKPAGNKLSAYEAETGRLLWQIGARDVPSKPPTGLFAAWRTNAIRFVSAPVPCSGMLLAPAEDSAGLCVVGLNAATGAPLWQTRIAPGIPLASPRSMPVTITMDGTDAYLCGGNGSVTSIDGVDGSVRWTNLYEPCPDAPATNRTDTEKTRMLWEESLVMVAGDTAVTLPADSPEILAFDRRNGTRLWTKPQPEGVDYVVGRQGSTLIAAGGTAVVGVDLTTGRERWRAPIEGSTGRGTLCGPDVLIPCGHAIVRLRAADGAPLGSMRAQTAADLPLGNLYVNGAQLLVAGPERIYALADARGELDRASERLSRQPTAEAYAGRGRLYAAIDRHSEAAADFREAWKRLGGPTAGESARIELLISLWRAANQNPKTAEEFHKEASSVAASSHERTESAWRWAVDRERAGNVQGAIELYATLLAAADALIPPVLDDTSRVTSAHRLAAHRVRLLSGSDARRASAILDEPAAQALGRLGPTPSWADLVELAMSFPGTPTGKQAALKAAQVAANGGNLGTAEAILQRMLTVLPLPDRDAVAEELIRLYEKMKWPMGVTRLLQDWPRLCPGAPPPNVLERAAAAASAAPAQALPPWRLRWRSKLPPGASSIHIVPAGLYYSFPDSKQNGCLALDNGRARWLHDAALFPPVAETTRMTWDDVHIVPALAGESGSFVDLWSGTVTTNALLLTPDYKASYPTLSPIGLATASSRTEGGLLTAADALTGRILWQRRELEPLLGEGVLPVPYSSSAIGVFLMRCEPDGAGTVVALDPWTGDIAFRCTVISGGRQLGRTAAQGGIWSVAFPRTPEREAPAVVDQRLFVRDRRTAAPLWTTPPDMPILRCLPMPGGLLAETTAHELLLFDSGNGRILCRSGNIAFPFDNAIPSMAGDTVIAVRRSGGEYNDVMALDPTAGKVVFHGRLPMQLSPLASLGSALPGVLLAGGFPPMFRDGIQSSFRGGIIAFDEKGGNANGWRLPRTEDAGATGASNAFTPYFANDSIILLDTDSGDVMNYSHDLVGGKSQP